MKTRFLFPSIFRLIGYVMAIPGFILGYFVLYRHYQIPGFGYEMRKERTLFKGTFENFTNETALALVIIGLIFVAFSKIKKEDELTGRLRLNALYWAVLVNFIWYTVFVILSVLNLLLKWPLITAGLDAFTGDNGFLIYNLFTPLLIFIARFYYLVYRNQEDSDFTEIRLMPNKPYNVIGKWLSLGIIIIVFLTIAVTDNFFNNTICWALPITMMIWLYAQEKDEDEYIKALRLDAMHVAIYANYAVLLLSDIFVYGAGFFTIQIINIFTIPLIFQARFQYRLSRLRHSNGRNNSVLTF